MIASAGGLLFRLVGCVLKLKYCPSEDVDTTIYMLGTGHRFWSFSMDPWIPSAIMCLGCIPEGWGYAPDYISGLCTLGVRLRCSSGCALIACALDLLQVVLPLTVARLWGTLDSEKPHDNCTCCVTYNVYNTM